MTMSPKVSAGLINYENNRKRYYGWMTFVGSYNQTRKSLGVPQSLLRLPIINDFQSLWLRRLFFTYWKFHQILSVNQYRPRGCMMLLMLFSHYRLVGSRYSCSISCFCVIIMYMLINLMSVKIVVSSFHFCYE